MADLDIDRVRRIVGLLTEYETIDELAKQHRLDDADVAALNPALGGIVKTVRNLHKELEDDALNIARALIHAIDEKDTP